MRTAPKCPTVSGTVRIHTQIKLIRLICVLTKLIAVDSNRTLRCMSNGTGSISGSNLWRRAMSVFTKLKDSVERLHSGFQMGTKRTSLSSILSLMKMILPAILLKSIILS
mgnify:CR=1 FL=1